MRFLRGTMLSLPLPSELGNAVRFVEAQCTSAPYYTSIPRGTSDS